MAVFESLFDMMYLFFVIGLGIHLVLQSERSSKLFGVMGIVLGLGDSFHLIPRIIAHWSPLGFEGNVVILSWGKMVTSITMTLFYLLYYYFLKRQTGMKNAKKDYWIYFLVVARIVLTALPQNNWGTMEENQFFALLRNLPFAILGITLIVWSYQNRNIRGVKYMPVLITASFLFYVPVVLWSKEIPALGAFMLPKTVAYFLIVYMGYRQFMPAFNTKRLAESAFVYLVFGLFSGVFYREFTKAYDFVGQTPLSRVHTHILTLGFVALLVLFAVSVLLSEKDSGFIQKLRKPMIFWHIGIVMTISIFMMRGIIDVLGGSCERATIAMITGISGIGHMLLSVGLLWTMMVICKADIAMNKKAIENAGNI